MQILLLAKKMDDLIKCAMSLSEMLIVIAELFTFASVH